MANDLPIFHLQGRVALVTGATGGLGRALVAGLCRAGARVVAAGRSAEKLAQLQEEMDPPGIILPVVCDLGDPGSLQQLVTRVGETFDRIDILVNNAATSPAFRPAEEWTLADWDQVMAVNLRGTFVLTQIVGRKMIAQRSGRIINISALGSQIGAPLAVGYAATKGALDAMTRTLASEWARYGITVNAVAPGYMDTGMIAEFTGNPRVRERLERRIPLRRLADPAEVVGAVLYLASDAASYHTGQVLTVDGGWSVW